MRINSNTHSRTQNPILKEVPWNPCKIWQFLLGIVQRKCLLWLAAFVSERQDKLGIGTRGLVFGHGMGLCQTQDLQHKKGLPLSHQAAVLGILKFSYKKLKNIPTPLGFSHLLTFLINTKHISSKHRINHIVVTISWHLPSPFESIKIKKIWKKTIKMLIMRWCLECSYYANSWIIPLKKWLICKHYN